MKTPSPLALATGGLISLAIAMGIGRFLYTPVLPVMMSELGLSASQAGLIASFNYIGYFVGALLAGASFIKGKQRSWVLACLVLSSVTTLLMGLTESIPLFLLLRFLGGVASAFILVFSSALIMEYLGQINRPGLTSIHFAGLGVGVILSTCLSWLLIANGSSWSTLWLGSGILCLLAVPLVTYLIPDFSHADKATTPTAKDDQDMMRRITISYGLFGFAYVITATFLIAIARSSGSHEAIESIIWIAFGFAAIISYAVCDWLMKRLGIFNAYAVTCIIMAVGISFSVLWPTTPGLILAAVFLGGTLIGGSGLALNAARLLSGSDPHKAMAIVTASFSLGQIIGPIFAGILKDYSGSYLSPSLTAAMALFIAAALVFRRAWSAP